MNTKSITSRRDFAPIMAFMSVSLGIAVDTSRQEAYYITLCDIDAKTLWRAAREIIAVRTYSTFPLAGEIRKHAVAIKLKVASAPTPVEAWATVLRLMSKFDIGYVKFDKILTSIDNSHLREFLRRFGPGNLHSLAFSDEGNWERSRFERAYSNFLESLTKEHALAIPDSNSDIPRLIQSLAMSLSIERHE